MVGLLQEGKQASLAADFSISQFKHIGRLLMVHGRNSYKRSAALGQFVMHRGLIISTMQVVQLGSWHPHPAPAWHFSAVLLRSGAPAPAELPALTVPNACSRRLSSPPSSTSHPCPSTRDS